MFESILPTTGLTTQTVLLCFASSIVCGLIISWIYIRTDGYSKNFAITVVLLPALVQSVILMVNGNLGTGVAVAGAFSLVRFRSMPGSSKDIAIIFFAMAAGLATGTGYVVFALLFSVLIGALLWMLSVTRFGTNKKGTRELRVTIPEHVDYQTEFVEPFEKYTKHNELVRVKTTSLGSMFELRYQIELSEPEKEKEFIDALRCRNNNLPITCGQISATREDL